MAASAGGGPAPGLTRALMVASGFAGLGLQIVWTQQATLWLGHEAAAVLAVVTAFFGGLAVGAGLLAPRIERSARPARWYAACEAAIALWAVVLALAMVPVTGWLLDAMGAMGTTGAIGDPPGAAWQSAVAFIGTFLLLLPATAAMGTTLPAMQRLLAGARQQQSIALLYACNTAGAVLGVLATAFWLLPALGLTRTALLCAALNLLCAVSTLLWLYKASVPILEPLLAPAPAPAAVQVQVQPPAPVPTPAPALQSGRSPAAPRLLALLAATGLLGIGVEVLVVRVLSQLTEDTVYTFALLLAVYLVGTAVGAAIHHVWRGGTPAAGPSVAGPLLCVVALGCLLGSASLWLGPLVQHAVQQLVSGMAGALAAEAALAMLAFGLPTVAMGLLFSELTAQARAAGIGFGHCLAANTLGAAAAPPLFGVLLAPALGPKAALLLVAMGYVALACWTTTKAAGQRQHKHQQEHQQAHSQARPQAHPQAHSQAQQHNQTHRPAWRRSTIALPAGAALALAAALALWAPPLAFIDVPPGGHVVRYNEGALAAVSVVEDAAGVLRLRIDNRQQEGSSATQLADGRQALLPLLLHPAPRRVLFLGLGTGTTAATAAQDPALERVDAVDLLPEVIAASSLFTGALLTPAGSARLHVLAADARRHVRSAGPPYDVIVSDNFHPARSGSGALYTVEHFRAVRQRLAAGGVFCQWLPLHQLDLPTLRSIVQAFIAVNPGAVALLATNSLQTPVLGLLAHHERTARVDVAQLQRRLDASALPLADFGLAEPLAVLGSMVAGPQALQRLAGNAPVNTDDHPVVAYAAPRVTYAPDSTPGARLLALLPLLAVTPTDVVDTRTPPAWQQRLGAYWAARDAFIAAGRNVQPARDVGAMLGQVRAPLLAVLHTSPDFRPAYDPLLRMAVALAPRDPQAARQLLGELVRLQPTRPEAGQALLRLPVGATD